MFAGYLKIDGIQGESTVKGFENQIEILSFGHGISHPGAMSRSTAGGLSEGVATHADFSVVKQLDKASPLLAKHCSDGKHFKAVLVTLVRSGGDKMPFMEYKLSDAMITGYRPGGSSQSDGLPLEEVSIAYSRIDWTYTQQNAQGKPGGKVTGSADLKT